MSLTGSTRIGGWLHGPGSFVCSGPANFRYAELTDGTSFENNVNSLLAGSDSADLGICSLCSFLNNGTLNIDDGADVEGGGLFDNSGSIVVKASGARTTFDTSYQQSGDLSVVVRIRFDPL